MPKAEKGSTKDIGKKIKAKGLQKLKFFCQMCEKQCRDANGFKCHLQSESHLRQMKIFSENAGGIMDSYSKDFEKVFMDNLRMRHGTTKMMANRIYNEVIQDKEHVHMNSTMWASLTDFCKYLGKTGKCVVEETERGWWVTYIERDVGKLAREKTLQRRLAAEQEAEREAQKRMERQRREQAELSSAKMEEATKLERSADGDGQPLKLALQTSSSSKPKRKAPKRMLGFGDDDDDDEEDTKTAVGNETLSRLPDPNALVRANMRDTKRVVVEAKKREPELSMEKGKKKKKQRNNDGDSCKKSNVKASEDTWLYKGIVVRIVNRDLADGKYFRRKAVVERLVASYTAELTVLEAQDGTADAITGDVLEMDQEDLETVVPKKEGVKVRILKGAHRGRKAKVRELDKASYTARLKVDDLYLDKVDFADFAEMA
jgi:DNA/RNA-binding protein KIN17